MFHRVIGACIAAGLVLCAAMARAQDTPHTAADGSALYAERCAACHDQTEGRAPYRAALASWLPSEIIYTLTKGAMRPQAAGLSAQQVQSLATFLTGRGLDKVPDPAANACTGAARPIAPGQADWATWGRDFQNARFQPDPGFAPADLKRLKVKWAFALPGLTGSPIVAGGRVFVSSRMGRVFALDEATGCTRWSYDAGAAVRNAVTIAALPDGRYGAFFGDQDTVVHALDAETGRELWKKKIDDYPSARIVGSVALHDGTLFVPVTSFDEVFAVDPSYPCCRFRGTIVALNAATGADVWKTHTIQEEPRETRVNSAGTQMYGPAGAGIWTALTVDAKRGRIYAATGDSYTDTPTDASNALVAFDLKTGKRVWATQVLKKDSWIYHCKGERVGNCPAPQGPDFDFSSAPGLHTLSDGKQVLVAGAKSATLFAFDPDQRGKLLWQTRIGQGLASTLIWGPASDGVRVFAGVPGKALDSKTEGGLFALDLKTGKVDWQTPAPTPACDWGAAACQHSQSGAVTAVPGLAFSGALDGHVRAYDAATGTILWDFDVGGDFDGVNGARAYGGNIDGAALTAADGMLFVNAGNATLVAPHHGDAVLALSPDGK